VLVISDFDPAGNSIPAAIARKAEHRIRTDGLDVDLHVRSIALIAEQVEEFDLPRIPINDKKRSGKFEERHGEGGCELDALEALPDDPHDDPLFDSSRTYLDQIERYRRHRGQEANPVVWHKRRLRRTCEMCGDEFEASKPRAKFCGSSCRQKLYRRNAKGLALRLASASLIAARPNTRCSSPLFRLMSACLAAVFRGF
jgi:hypothetical protein